MDNSASDKFVFISQVDGFEIEHENAVSNWLTDTAIEHNRSIRLIEYVFCDDTFLLELNKKHLSHDYLTDILTFPLKESPIEANIFISIDRVKENAITYGVNFLDELHRVMVHGLLHLIGYDDHDENEKKKMRYEEDKSLATRNFI